MDNQANDSCVRVLCIDDHSEMLQIEKSILEGAGYAVLTADSGPEAITLAESHKVDLVVVDCWMPGMSGPEVVQRLRAKQPTLPVIMVSASTLPDDVAQSVDRVLLKSQIGDLAAEVNRLVAKTGRG